MRYILEVNEHVEPEELQELRSYKNFWNAISGLKPRTPS